MFKLSKQAWKEIIKKSLAPLTLLALFISIYLYYRMALLPLISEKLQQDLGKYFGTIFIICIAFNIQAVSEAVLAWYKANIAAKTKTRLDDKLIPILARTLKVTIWVIALLVILPFYGVNISALIAALGVGSLAIALAAQDTIANIIAGYLIMIDAPFEIGDRIKLPTGELVEVLDIGVRRSKFLSEDKALIIVPNVDLSKNKIVNYTYAEK
jgi:small-conductance mechanosensitive channel